MRRTLTLLTITIVLAYSASAAAHDQQIKRWIGIGYGPGYHSGWCCNGPCANASPVYEPITTPTPMAKRPARPTTSAMRFRANSPAPSSAQRTGGIPFRK